MACIRRTCCSLLVVVIAGASSMRAEPWARHTIDRTSRGADGARLADIDDDGDLDVVTGWEEGGLIRVYVHPGNDLVQQSWPFVTVGGVASPEDAVLVDIDRDGRRDVVSCSEGRTRLIHVHWAPAPHLDLLDERLWITQEVPVSRGQMWMYCLPLDGDEDDGLIVGSKGSGATISRLRTAHGARDVEKWTLDPLCDAGWIMSLIATDMDGDGDADVLFSDRKGPARGCKWLENTGPATEPEQNWPLHVIGGSQFEVMFLDIADLDGDNRAEIAVATRDGGVLVFRAEADSAQWSMQEIPMPANVGTGKSVRIADVNLDGKTDLVVSCENAGHRVGVFWLDADTTSPDDGWSMHEIGGVEVGTKFDLLQMVDLDADGDLDVLTCEERDNLGVIWYENPFASARSSE